MPLTPVLLPRDTSAVVQDHMDECQHLGLMLDKYQPRSRDAGWDLFVPFVRDTRDGPQPGIAKSNEAKGVWFGVGLDASRPRRRPQGRILRRKVSKPSAEKWDDLHGRIDHELFQAFDQRWQLVARNAHARTFRCVTQSRLVVGLGGEHTLETAITFHRNYGIPIIPGSAVKGIARAYAFFTLAEELKVDAVDPGEFKHRRIDKPKRETPLSALQGLLDANEKDWDEWVHKIARAGGPQLNVAQLQATVSVQQFRQTFGWLGHAGGATFFDAIPVTRLPQIVVDVMNPHYPKYYSGTEAPNDAQKPNPITFLVVDTGARFQFAVAPNRYPADQPFAELGEQWLTRALQWLGIGGKTMSGYGLFGAPEQ